MSAPSADSSLPQPYARWVSAIFGGPPPAETHATCDDCAMCLKPDRPLLSELTYQPDVRCCTYAPGLPNFIAGAILADDHPENARGRAALAARLSEDFMVTPMGVKPPMGYQERYARQARTFGTGQALRCPYLFVRPGGDGRCGIWRHREAVCSTFFCKHDRGAVGQRFWSALEWLLGTVESELAIWCVLQVGIGEAALGRLFPPAEARATSRKPLIGPSDPEWFRSLFGDWRGRERELFMECARRVEALGWDEVRAIGGEATIAAEARLRQAHAELVSDRVPLRLRLGNVQILAMDGERVSIWGHSNRDALELPVAQFEQLERFDGRPTDETAGAGAEAGAAFEPDELRRLVDFGILVE